MEKPNGARRRTAEATLLSRACLRVSAVYSFTSIVIIWDRIQIPVAPRARRGLRGDGFVVADQVLVGGAGADDVRRERDLARFGGW